MTNTISKKKLYHEIVSMEQLDYVAYALTPFHLLGIKAYLEKLHDELNRDIKGIIIIGKNPRGGFIVKECELQFPNYIDNKAFYYDMQNQGGEDLIIEKIVPRTISCITPMTIWLKLIVLLKKTKYNVNAVIIDDGTASYDGTLKLALRMSSITNNYSSFILTIVKEIINKLFITMLNVKVTNFSVFSKKNFMDEKNLYYYRKVLAYGRKELSEEKKYVLYLGTVTDEDDNYKIVNDVGNKVIRVLTDNKYDVLIKSHPRQQVLLEDDSLYKNCLPQDLSIEELIGKSKYNIVAVVGWDSSALITIPVLYGIPAISLVKAMKKSRKDNALFEIKREQKKARNLYIMEPEKMPEELIRVIKNIENQ